MLYKILLNNTVKKTPLYELFVRYVYENGYVQQCGPTCGSGAKFGSLG